MSYCQSAFFFFNDTATTEIYTLSLHDALPIYQRHHRGPHQRGRQAGGEVRVAEDRVDRGRQVEAQRTVQQRVVLVDRKSTRLNSSHANISYAVFCLKKKNITYTKLSNKHLIYQ